MPIHTVEITRDALRGWEDCPESGATATPDCPAGAVVLNLHIGLNEVEVLGVRLGGGKLRGVVFTLKSLDRSARELAADLGYSYDGVYIARMVEIQEVDYREAYAAAATVG